MVGYLANATSQCLVNVCKRSTAGLVHNPMTTGSPALRGAPAMDPVAILGQRV